MLTKAVRYGELPGMDNRTPIQIAVEWAGGTKVELAQRLGVKKSTVSMWGDDLPDLRCYEIEVKSKRKVKAAQLFDARQNIERAAA